MRRSIGILLIAVVADVGFADEPNVDLSVVKLADFQKAVQANRGKIVVVCFWADYSAPDVKLLGNFVALHARWKERPVVFMTLCHSAAGAEKRQKVMKILQTRKAALSNYLLDDDVDVWQKEFKIEALPVVFVFDPSGAKLKTIEYGEDTIARTETFLKSSFAPKENRSP